MNTTLKIIINEKLYLKDPDETELGRKIISSSIKMIDELGFEQFTFKKLAAEINSTEASVYRYFENKHRLLFYIISWYWGWLDYRISYETNNIKDPHERMKIIIKVISEKHKYDPIFTHINESILHRIVISEAVKVYLTKDVDNDNKEGFFKEYKHLCKQISKVIQEINPKYKFANSLASTLIESAHQQLYFSLHFRTITDFDKMSSEGVAEYLEHLAFSAIKSN